MKSKVILSFASLLTIAVALPAYAQQTSAEAPAGTGSQTLPATNQAAPGDSSTPANGSSLEDIVVTARRVSENVQSIPVAVTALSGASLESKSVRDLKDIGTAVPNLFIRDGPQNAGSALITIRGQSQPDQPITIQSAVGLYVDNVNYPHAFGVKGNLIDIQRVEVLRGPQGTLYGKNTTGGAFSVITRSPTDELGASLKAIGGNYATYGLTGILNLPIVQGAALRLVGSFSNRDDGFGHDGAGRPLGKEQSRFVRAKLKLDPAENVKILISGDYQHYTNSGATFRLAGPAPFGSIATISYGLEKGILNFASAGLLAGPPFNIPPDLAKLGAAQAAFNNEGLNVPGGKYNTNGTALSGASFTGYGGSVDATWDVTDHVTLRSITGLRYYRTADDLDIDGTSASILSTHGETPFDQNLTQEFQLVGKYSHFKYVFGLYGSDETGRDGSAAIALEGLLHSRNTTDATITNRSLGAFGQATWEFTKNWSLTGGIRYTTERQEMTSRNRNSSLITGAVVTVIPAELQTTPAACLASAATDAAIAANCQFKSSVTASKPSWLVSLDHNLNEDTLVYAKASHSFRGGGNNIRGSGLAATFATFNPEVVTEYEAGLKTELFDRRVRVNIAAYYDNLSGVQRSVLVRTPSGQTATVLTNAATARTYGFEFETTWRVNKMLTLNGAFSNNNPKYKQFIDFTGDRSKEAWPTPDWQANAGADLKVPISAGSINAHVDYYYQSAYNSQGVAIRSAEVSTAAYSLVNGRVGVTIDRLGVDVAAFVKNLTNKYYITAPITLDGALGYNVASYGEPRTFGVEVTMRFGGERR